MSKNANRLYNDLAWLWPLWGDPTAEYADWCNQVTRLIRQYAKRDVHTLLNLGCGGGKNVFNLKHHFVVTGVDLSPAMLDLAQRLNPECLFVLGDMRTCSLDKAFDAVLVDDAISYMTSDAELSAVFQNVYHHLRVGGVMVVEPDDTTETFQQNRTRVNYAHAKAKPDPIDVAFIENYYDPNPSDDTYEGTFVYLIRDHGQLRIETDHHVLGLFSLQVWRTVLHAAGFEVHEEACSEEPDRITFACVKHA